MNPVHAYYVTLLHFLRTGDACIFAGRQTRTYELELIGLEEKARAANTQISYEGKQGDNKLLLLLRCVNDSNNIRVDEKNETLEAFLLAAYKDLSVMKNPLAMLTFAELKEICKFDFRLLLWARKIKEGGLGSAVVTLHVSDLEKFQELLHLYPGSTALSPHPLEGGMMVL